MLLGYVGSFCVASAKTTFDDHVFPIFEANCLNCHNPDKAKGGLDLSTYSGTLAGGSSGEKASPGNGADALLFKVITHQAEPAMPPEGDALSKQQANVIRAWIDEGMLETADSKAKKAKKNTLLEANADPTKSFEGPPPLPSIGLFPQEPVTVTPASGTILDMEASPRAPLLAVTGYRQVVLYHTESLELQGIIPFPDGVPETLAFHPSGQFLTIGGGVPGKKGSPAPGISPVER